MKSLIVLPNFQIIVLKGEELKSIIKIFADSITINSQSETFSLTANSFWRGLNKATKFDFISVLIDNCEQIPNNVLEELENWEIKFGDITLLKENCLQISSESLKEEILKHNVFSKYVYSYHDKLIFFKDISLTEIVDIFEKELNYPVKLNRSKESIAPEVKRASYYECEDDEEEKSIQQRQLDLYSEIHHLLFKNIMKIYERI